MMPGCEIAHFAISPTVVKGCGIISGHIIANEIGQGRITASFHFQQQHSEPGRLSQWVFTKFVRIDFQITSLDCLFQQANITTGF
jgi:hypothetical protein